MEIATLIVLILILIQITRTGHQICKNQVAQSKLETEQLGHVITQLRKLNRP